MKVVPTLMLLSVAVIGTFTCTGGASTTPEGQRTDITSPSGSTRGPDGGPIERHLAKAADWGPLAVTEPGNWYGRDDVGASIWIDGEIAIGVQCVTVRDRENGAEHTLLWPASLITWNPEDRVIRFWDGEEYLELRNGSRAHFGMDLLPYGVWIAEPDASCPPALGKMMYTRPG